MIRIIAIILMSVLVRPFSAHAENMAAPQFYRDLTLRVRSEGEFKVPLPAAVIKYKFELADPFWPEPIVSDLPSTLDPKNIHRSVWDRYFLKDGSFIEIAGERMPLTCLVISGQDNRYGVKDGPLFPDLILRVYLIANDYTCQGPIRPGWPQSGGRKEAWDTYLHYEIRDPSIMLPMDALVRYRWNEFSVVLVDRGPQL